MAKTMKLKKGDKLSFIGSDDEQIPYEEGETLIVHSTEKSEDGRTLAVVYSEDDDPDDCTMEQIFVPEEAEPKKAEAKKKTSAKKKAAKAAEPDEEEEFEDDDDADSDDDDGEEESDDDGGEEFEDDDDSEEEEADEEEEAPKTKRKSTKKDAAKLTKKTPAKKSAKKSKAPARTEDEAAEEEIEHTKSVKKIIKKGDMLDAAKSLVAQADQSYFNLGGVLAEINRTKAYAELDYEADLSGFEEYISAELGIEYKKATRLMMVYKTFSKLGIDETRVLQVGWTKAGAIASLMRDATADEVEAMLDEAMEMTRDDLIEHIKETSVDAQKRSRGEKVKKVKFTFSAFADKATVIQEMIDNAMSESGAEDMNEAMDYIFTQYGMMVENVEVPLDDALKAVEMKYGVKLMIEDEQEEAEAEEMPKAKVKKPAAKKKTVAKKSSKKTATKKKAA